MESVQGVPEQGGPVAPASGARVDTVGGLAPESAAFLTDMAHQLAGSLNVRRTISRVLQMATPYLGDWVMVVLFDGRRATLTSRDFAGRTTGPVEVELEEGDRPGLDRIRRGGRTELRPVARTAEADDDLSAMIPDPALCAEAAELRPADVLGVELNARGGTIGALVVIRGGRGAFGESDIELIEEFAQQAATTLNSGLAYEERVHVAAVLQSSLRPPRLPEVAGARVAARYRAAQEHLDIGGDFYDVHGAGEEYSVVIGDVCGKGLHAAVLTGRARQTIRTAAHFTRAPSGILAALNEVLYDEDSDRFVTVACASVRQNPATGGLSVRLAVAGHPPPFVLRADGGVEQPEVSGTLSGVLPELSYEEVLLELGPGDQLLFYTDGIYEAKGADGLLGLDRLRDILPEYAGAEPDALCEAVEQRVIRHLAGAAHDDMALLALRAGD